MQLTNTTNIDNKTIRDLIRFAKPSNISNFDVMLKNNLKSKHCVGTAYSKGSSYHYSSRPFIVVRVPNSEQNYPYKTSEGRGYISTLILNKLEDVLYVLAHELRHLWQSKVKRGHRVWGARGQYSERDADAYAMKIVRAFRKKQRGKNEMSYM